MSDFGNDDSITTTLSDFDFDKLLELSTSDEHKESFDKLFRHNRIKNVIDELLNNSKCSIGFDVVGDDDSITTTFSFKYPRSNVESNNV